MKTKTLLLAVALAGAGAVSGVAQTVYSVNAVGFVNVVIPPLPAGPNSFSILSNPLDAADNSVAALFPNAPLGSAIYKFVGGAFVANNRGFTAWSSPAMTLVPGEAFFFRNPSATQFTNTFVGEVKQGTGANALTTPLVGGFQLVASQVPQSGLVSTDLGLPIALGEAVYRFQSGAYLTFNRGFTTWSPSEPTIQAGEGFFLKKNPNPANWVRNFSVNQ